MVSGTTDFTNRGGGLYCKLGVAEEKLKERIDLPQEEHGRSSEKVYPGDELLGSRSTLSEGKCQEKLL